MKTLAKKSLSLIFLGMLTGCSLKTKDFPIQQEDNHLIAEMHQKDIEIRKIDTLNWEEYDKKHREKIFQLLAENKVITAKDKIKAAWILQHTAAKICNGELTSISPENFLLAYKLSSEALQLLKQSKDTATISREHVPRIIALNYDRYLLYTYGYQKFGTQFVFDDKTGEMLLAPIDTTLANDEERKIHDVESLNLLMARYKIKPMTKE